LDGKEKANLMYSLMLLSLFVENIIEVDRNQQDHNFSTKYHGLMYVDPKDYTAYNVMHHHSKGLKIKASYYTLSLKSSISL